MKKIILVHVFALFATCFLFSCKSNIIDDETLPSNPLSLEVRSDARPDAEEFNVTKDMAEYYAKSFTERPAIKSIQSYDYNGVTCLYIVNFEKGWMAIPADSRVQPILGESEKENLNPDELNNPGVRIWLEDTADNIYHVKQYGLKEYNKESLLLWNGFRKQITNNLSKSVQPGEIAWVKYSYSTTSTQTEANVGHLLQTSWGQGTPWNCSLPIDPAAQNGDTTRFVTGCVPTAISQVLYYYHNKNGYPSDFWHFIEPSVSQVLGDGFYKLTLLKDNYNSYSSRWASMPTTSYSSGGFSNVSDLMLDVGVRMNASYSSNATGARLEYSWDLNPCGITCQRSSYDYTTIRSNIINNNPVIITADLFENNRYVGHAWVIDGCVDRTTTTNYYSTYYEYHEGYSYPSGSQFLTDNEVTVLYPNVYDGMTVLDSSQSNTLQYLLMNYGWDGDYDDGHYSILKYSNDWAIGLNYNKLIFFNITTGQLN